MVLHEAILSRSFEILTCAIRFWFLLVHMRLHEGAATVWDARDRCPRLVQKHWVHQWLRPSGACHQGTVLPVPINILDLKWIFFLNFLLIPVDSNLVYFMKTLTCSNTWFLSFPLDLWRILSIVKCTQVSASSVVSASLLFTVVLAGSEESESGGVCSSSAVCHWQVR